MKRFLPLAMAAALAGCSSEGANNAAEQIEGAAELSNPAAAPAMEDGVEGAREQSGNESAPQNTLQPEGQ